MSDPSPPDKDSGPVPKAPIREDSISQFKKGAGDPSKSLLYLVIVGVALLILGILFFTKAPEGTRPTPAEESTKR
jgi:hypothetical protein